MAGADELVGRTLGDRYRLLARIGKGGMADVYRAEDRSQHRTIALKLLRSRRPDYAARLRREYQILTSLAHPRVVDVLELGTGSLGPFYTMELLEHGDLRSVQRPVGLKQACELLRQVAVALTFLHARQFVHRDITPGNIRFAADGRLKLIDFGVMMTAGSVPEDIAGTPPFLAPESLRGAPIDHRADLFALGALGYWLVTGEHAYPADALDSLPARWAAGPPSLRTARPDLPEELDDLIRLLLRPDRDARPGNAVEVIGRLTTLGELPPVASDEVARSFISSAAVVGREDEVARLRDLVQQVNDGRGAAVALVGRAGSGKSRLLLELRVAAEIAGVPVVRLDGRATGPGFVDALIAAVERVRPRCRELSSHAALIEARRRDQAEDALAHQLVVQDAVARWLSELARKQPIVVSIDDGQRLRAYPIGIVTAIVRASATSPMLAVVAYRNDEDTDDLRQLEWAMRDSIPVTLPGLSVEAVEALVESTVGRVPVGKRLATWLHQGTGGNPLLCIEALRALVDDGTLRFADGVWSIDMDLHERAPPGGLREQTEERIAGLSSTVRDVGSRLAVYRNDFDLDEAPDVADTTEPFAAVGQLVRAGLLVGGPNRFSFVRRDVRECFIDRLAPEERRRLHRHAATLLEARSDATALELGWHWLRGGDPRRGAELLEAEGRRLHGQQLLSECVAPLEAALRVYETDASEQGRTLELRVLILDAAIMVDRSAFIEHVDRARADAWRQSGFEVAERLRPRLGARMSMLAGIGSAFAVWLATRKSKGRLRPDRALVHALASLVYGGSFSKNRDDTKRLEQILEASKVLDGFRGFTPYAAGLMVRSYVHANRGEWTEMERVNKEALELLERDTLIGLTERERAMARGEILNNLAVVPLVRSDPSFGRAVERANLRGITAFSVGAEALQVCSLRLHGRESEARRLELALESRIARLGSLWIFEGLLLEQSTYAYAHYGDLGGLRRTRETLQQQVDKGVRSPHVLQLATAVCDALVGRHAEAADSLSELWASLPRRSERRLPTAVALGRSLVWLGRFDQVDALLREALALARDETCGNPLYAGHLLRIAAAARREQGRLDEASRRLREAEAIARRLQCPGLQALLHETRARILLSREDLGAARSELVQMEALARSVGNAVLMQRQRELTDKLEEALGTVRERAPAAVIDETAVLTRARTTVRARPGQESTRSRTDDVAQWILAELDCAEAHLFTPPELGGDVLASAPFGTPPPRVAGELARVLGVDGEQMTVVADAGAQSPTVHRLYGGPKGAVIAVLVTVGARRTPEPAVLDEIGRRLGDVYE